jgi:hypothetical protein
VAAQQGEHVALGRAAEHRGTGDLVLVEVQDRQHGTVVGGVEEADPLPRALQRGGLRLAVADDAGDEQVGVVERGTEGVDERVPELAALVDRAGRRDADVAGDPARRGELAHEREQARVVAGDQRVGLGVGPLEVDVRHDRGAAVPRAGDVEHLLPGPANEPVELRVDEVQAR